MHVLNVDADDHLMNLKLWILLQSNLSKWIFGRLVQTRGCNQLIQILRPICTPLCWKISTCLQLWDLILSASRIFHINREPIVENSILWSWLNSLTFFAIRNKQLHRSPGCNYTVKWAISTWLLRPLFFSTVLHNRNRTYITCKQTMQLSPVTYSSQKNDALFHGLAIKNSL